MRLFLLQTHSNSLFFFEKDRLFALWLVRSRSIQKRFKNKPNCSPGTVGNQPSWLLQLSNYSILCCVD